jgi:sortase A
MRSKRPLSEYSVEELERMLAIRRREERQKRLTRLQSQGRVVAVAPTTPKSKPVKPTEPITNVQPTAPAAPVQKPQVSAISTEGFTLDTLESMLQGGAPTAPVSTSQPIRAISPTVNPASYGTIDILEDELDDFDDAQADDKPVKPLSRRILDRLLLVVEVGAVIALLVIGGMFLTETTNLQRETALIQEEGAAQRLAGVPTAAPTSVIQLAKLEDYLLPGGHLIDEGGRVVLNTNEISGAVPAHLQASVIAQAYAIDFVRPPKTAETALQLFIPDLNIDAPIVQGADTEALKLGVGQVINGANPTDDASNVALAAHNDVYSALFQHIDQLEEGDVIQVQTENQLYNYYVTHWEQVKPTEVRVLESQGVPMVTLISCYPYGVNNMRYIVYAVREDAYGRQQAPQASNLSDYAS